MQQQQLGRNYHKLRYPKQKLFKSKSRFASILRRNCHWQLASKGYAPSGYAPAGYALAWYAMAGYAPAGYVPAGYASSGYASESKGVCAVKEGMHLRNQTG